MNDHVDQTQQRRRNRVKLALAGLALAGSLAAGVAAGPDVEDVAGASTTESTAAPWYSLGLSWH